MEKQNIERDIQNFAQMYPNVDYKGKYVLWLQLDLWCPNGCELVDCSLSAGDILGANLVAKTSMVPLNLAASRNYHTACMKNGDKVSDVGAVLYFDTFEELEKVKSVVLNWRIKQAAENGVDYYIQVLYNLSFEKDPVKKVYTICDCARIMHDVSSMEDKTAHEKYMKKFTSVCVFRHEGNGSVTEEFIKGEATAESRDCWKSLRDVKPQNGEQFMCELTLKPESFALLLW